MVEPKTKADQDKMGIGLQKLAEEDPTFRVETNPETGETVISGMGELHLDVLVDRLKREHKVEANVGAPQVSYRETFRAGTQARGFFKRQSGGKGQFGDVWIEFTPNEEGKGFEFENAIVGGVVPREFIPAVKKDWKNLWLTVSLLDTQWLTSKLSFTMVHTTMSIHLKLPSRSLRLLHLKKLLRLHNQLSLNQ